MEKIIWKSEESLTVGARRRMAELLLMLKKGEKMNRLIKVFCAAAAIAVSTWAQELTAEKKEDLYMHQDKSAEKKQKEEKSEWDKIFSEPIFPGLTPSRSQESSADFLKRINANIDSTKTLFR